MLIVLLSFIVVTAIVLLFSVIRYGLALAIMVLYNLITVAILTIIFYSLIRYIRRRK